MAVFTDAQIDALITEPKALVPDWLARLRPKAGRIGHSLRDLDVRGSLGSEFRIIVRQSEANALDFSVILAYRPQLGPRLFRLRRYNGRSHEHHNRIEGDRFYDFHIHQATERYQLLGMDEDAYATPTTRYADLGAACQLLVLETGFEVAGPSQLALDWMDSVS